MSYKLLININHGSPKFSGKGAEIRRYLSYYPEPKRVGELIACEVRIITSWEM